MRKAILLKIKSERGASLSMAILLFMVCAVVGGVILAAATAAGGRASQLAENDQRYYNVTSAAQLLAEVLEGKEITITRTLTYTLDSDDVWVDAEMMGIDENNPIPSNASFTTPDISGNPSFLSTQAEYLLFLGAKPATPTAQKEKWTASFSYGDRGASPIADAQKTFTLTFSDIDNDTPLGPVNCTGGVLENGTMKIVVSGSSGSGTYIVTLVMEPDIDETVETTYGVDLNGDNTVTITKTSTISWSLSSIE